MYSQGLSNRRYPPNNKRPRREGGGRGSGDWNQNQSQFDRSSVIDPWKGIVEHFVNSGLLPTSELERDFSLSCK